MIKKVITFAVTLAVCMAMAAYAQQELRVGSTVNEFLSSGGEFNYMVRPTTSGSLTVETTGSTDTYMWAYNSNRVEIDSNDDGGQDYNARITLDVRANETYYFRIRGYNNSTSGNISVVASMGGASQGSTGQTELRIGSPVSEYLNPGAEFNYMVRPTSNGTLVVETTGSIDTYMWAYNSNMQEIESNDDGGQDYNARISLQASANQTYYFRVRGYSNSTSGSFGVSANMSGGGSASPGSTGQIELRVGSSLSGQISNGSEFTYMVRATANGTLVVETSGSIDTYMHAYNSSMREIDVNDDGGQGLNARIAVEVRANEVYYFKVRGYSNSVNGSFTVSATMAGSAPGANPSSASGRELRVGSSLSEQLNSNGEFLYTVRPTAGGTLVVETSGDLDTMMWAYDSNMRELDSNDDSGQGYNARISLTVRANETYYFKVRGYNSSTSGPFAVSAYMW